MLLLLMYLAGIPLILVHELAHGWAAVRRTGGRAEIQVGLGPRLFSVPAGPFDLALGPVPVAGHCRWHPTERTTLRDQAFVAAAGPAATLACFLILAVVAWNAGPGHPLLGAATASAGIMFLTSALPVHYGSLLPQAPVSDGLVVWQSLAGEGRLRGPRYAERQGTPPVIRTPFAVVLAVVFIFTVWMSVPLGLLLICLFGFAAFRQRMLHRAYADRPERPVSPPVIPLHPARGPGWDTSHSQGPPRAGGA